MQKQKLQLQLGCSLVYVSVGEKFRLVMKVFVWGFFALVFVFELTNFYLSSSRFHFFSLTKSNYQREILKCHFPLTFIRNHFAFHKFAFRNEISTEILFCLLFYSTCNQWTYNRMRLQPVNFVNAKNIYKQMISHLYVQ